MRSSIEVALTKNEENVNVKFSVRVRDISRSPLRIKAHLAVERSLRETANFIRFTTQWALIKSVT